MNKSDIDLIRKQLKESNNVVILGAGASVATMLDLNLPTPSAMDNFIKNANMTDILNDIKLDTNSNNLEDIYSEIAEKPEHEYLRKQLEERLHRYFSKFSLPTNSVSLYDLLFLSLRHEDCLATFNWDSLLIQAYYRVATMMQTWGIKDPFSLLPTPIFLHGNVGVGICLEHHQFGEIGNRCPICQNIFETMPLLYPIKNKDYTSNLYIKDAWDRLRHNLRYSSFLTIFGYGLPTSDTAILDVFTASYGDVKKKFINRFEVVDLKHQKELYKTWDKFIDHNGCGCYKTLRDTMILQYPRQDIDTHVRRNIDDEWCGEPVNYPNKMTWNDAKNIFLPILLKNNNTASLKRV